MTQDSFSSKSTFSTRSGDVELYRLDALIAGGIGDVATLPYSLRVLLENLLRNEDGTTVTREDILAVANWNPTAAPSTEIAYRPARVVLQDFTGVPAVVDLAAMREAFADMGGDPSEMNPLRPGDLVIDHSVQVDSYGSNEALAKNVEKEYARNRERYQFLRWGQGAFENLRVVPPGTGIVHQVNLEYLAQVVCFETQDGRKVAFPDTLVGTDSHTTMINGLGVVGWGVGGIEAEAAILGQPIAMLLPQVVGFKLTGKLPEGATATDLVLTVVEQLRQKGVVGKFVEFFGDGLDSLTLPDRATIANMAPEYGATMGFFPADSETMDFLRFTGRDDDAVADIETYLTEQKLLRTVGAPDPRFTDVVELDMSDVVPSIAGPTKPQQRIALSSAKASWESTRDGLLGNNAADKRNLAVAATTDRGDFEIRHGSVVIAAITSCTNTSNPAVLLAAGLVAKRARERGLASKPWVKTSLAPGSQVVTEYLREAGLLTELEALGFNIVGYGCTTCIGNSGPLHDNIKTAITDNDLVVAAVLSGNRNFEGRVSPHTLANYLASPPLVVAYAVAGTVDIDFQSQPIGQDNSGTDVYLRDIWPTTDEVNQLIKKAVQRDMFLQRYAQVFEGTEEWQSLQIPGGKTFAWDEKSTYIRKPSFFSNLGPDATPPSDISGARVLALLGDTVTTDHISPAGAIAPDSPAGRYLKGQGVTIADFNSYGSRRGNHEVMVRGTFANIRLKNLLAPGTEGGVTRHLPDGKQTSIYEAATQYKEEQVPLVVLAGKEYGTGSSRDWAAKGTYLLGVKAVIAESYERIHRSNLVGMGILPLQFAEGDSPKSLGLTGEEEFSITGISSGLSPKKSLTVQAGDKSFDVVCRVDTPQEVEYINHGGILQYVLRAKLKSAG